MSATIWIASGEGDGPGHRERYDGALTVRALKGRLTRERCGGDRWAHCLVETDTREPDACTPEDAIETATRGPGRPVSTGRGSTSGTVAVLVRVSAEERAALDAAAARAGAASTPAWVRAEALSAARRAV